MGWGEGVEAISVQSLIRGERCCNPLFKINNMKENAIEEELFNALLAFSIWPRKSSAHEIGGTVSKSGLTKQTSGWKEYRG